MKKNFFKSLFFTATLLLGLLPSYSFTKNEEVNEKQNNYTDYEEPNFDDNTSFNQLDFSSSINNLLNAKELIFDSLELNIYPEYTTNKKLSMVFTSLDIDLSNLNISKLNLSSNLKISYGGIIEDISLKIATTEIYIIHRGNAIRLEVPKTLNDIFSMLKAIGININSKSDSGNVSLSDLISHLTSSTYDKQESVDLSGYKYDIKFDDLSLSSSNISNLNFSFLTNKNNKINTIKSDGDILINDTQSNKKIGLNFNGSISSINDVSTYKNDINNGYINVTESASSLLGTITDIFSKKYNFDDETNENKTQVKIDFTGEIINEIDDSTKKTSYINGDIKANLTNVFLDENRGEFSFDLTQKSSLDDSSTIYNDISAYFNDETTYISLDNLFKGKIQNSKIKDLFSTISKITSIPSFKEIDSDLNLIFTIANKNSIDKFLDGDYSSVYDILNTYSVTSNSISISINPNGLGLQGDEITLSMIFDNDNSTLSSLNISGIKMGKITLNNLKFKLDKFDHIQIPDLTSYDDYSSNVSIFESVSSLVSNKKVNADYSLIYTDNKGETISSEGKIAADLSSSISSTDNETKVSILDGKYYLSFNLPTEKNNSLLGQGIEMYFDPTVSIDETSKGLLYFGYQYYKNENYHELDNNKYVFKNSIAGDDISKMYQLIDKKVSSNSSNPSISLESMSSFIKCITSSVKFKTLKNNLKNNLSLKELEGILSISSDTSGITVTLNPKDFIVNTSFQDNTESITLKLNDNSDVSELSIKGKIGGNSIIFSISLSDDDFSYSAFNIDDYPIINNASEILESFFSLPTDLQHFDISLNGSMKKNDVDLLKLSDTGASVDLTSTNNQASGIINLYHQDINDSSKLISSPQKLEFYYQETSDTITRNDNSINNSDLIIEYNDNMHIKMQNSDLFDIYDSILSISETNLLNRYIKLVNETIQSNNSPLISLINGKSIIESKILSKPFIKEVSFKESQIDLKLDPTLFLSDAKSESYLTISIFYDLTSKKIKSASINSDYIDSKDNKYSLSFDVSLRALSNGENGNYNRNLTEEKNSSNVNNNILQYSSSTSSNFIDIYGLKVLIQCGIDTTENNYMQIEGTFYLKVGGLGSLIGAFGGDTKLYVKCHASIYIEDETVYCYLKFAVSTSQTFPTIKQDGYRVTEFFIKEDEVLVNQTKTERTSHGGFLGIGTKYTFTTSYQSYKTTGENVTQNIAYYILDYIMDLGRITGGETALNQIYSSMDSSSDSSVTIENDFSNVINEFSYSNDSFFFDFNLSSIISIPLISISKLNLNITHDNVSSKKPLKSISLNAKVSIASVLSIEITSSSDFNTFTLTDLDNITISEAKNTYMTRYYNFRENFYIDNGEYNDESITQMYLISEVKSKSSPTYTGTLLSKEYTSEKSSDKNSYTVTGYENDYHVFSW